MITEIAGRNPPNLMNLVRTHITDYVTGLHHSQSHPPALVITTRRVSQLRLIRESLVVRCIVLDTRES